MTSPSFRERIAKVARLLRLPLVLACVVCLSACFESYDGEGLINHALSLQELDARPQASLVYPKATAVWTHETPGGGLPHVAADREQVLVSSDSPEAVTRWYDAGIRSMGFAACRTYGHLVPEAVNYCGRGGSECSRQRFFVSAQSPVAAMLNRDYRVSSAVRYHPEHASYVYVNYFVYGPGYPSGTCR